MRNTTQVSSLVDRLKKETGVKGEDEMADFIEDDMGGYAQDETEAFVARNVTLPSNLDSKLWRLKVKLGFEKQVVMRLTNKLIACLNAGHPLLVL